MQTNHMQIDAIDDMQTIVDLFLPWYVYISSPHIHRTEAI